MSTDRQQQETVGEDVGVSGEGVGGEATGGGGEGPPSDRVEETFSTIQRLFQEENDVREEIRTTVRALEQVAREIFTVMQAVHHTTLKDTPLLCSKIDKLFPAVRENFQKLKSIVPAGTYYRYHDHWRFVSQRLTFLTALLHYLRTGQLALRTDVATALGVSVFQSEGFHLDLDDYLTGLLLMASELSRLAVNSVVLGNYQRPYDIAAFMSDLSGGFRLLNLKNDFLRKRFDALKYDLKKIEEVVYDISIRGLKPTD